MLDGPSDFNIIHPDDYAAHGYPHHIWTRLRREDPVHWWDRTEGVPFWAVTKHADIRWLSRQPKRGMRGAVQLLERHALEALLRALEHATGRRVHELDRERPVDDDDGREHRVEHTAEIACHG